MFNSRDEVFLLTKDFYDPYKMGNYIEHISTGEIFKIMGFVESKGSKKVILKEYENEREGVIVISFKKLKEKYKKCERIIIERSPSEEECIHLDIPMLKLKK